MHKIIQSIKNFICFFQSNFPENSIKKREYIWPCKINCHLKVIDLKAIEKCTSSMLNVKWNSNNYKEQLPFICKREECILFCAISLMHWKNYKPFSFIMINVYIIEGFDSNCFNHPHICYFLLLSFVMPTSMEGKALGNGSAFKFIDCCI